MRSENPHVVAIIQARMGSTRLPGKILMDIDGISMLERVVERVGRAQTINQVVVATTQDEEDDQVANLCEQNDLNFVRGPNEDVLKRYVQAARKFGAEVVVRITADCPLMDPDVIDKTVANFLERIGEVDFGSNRGAGEIRRTYPIGMDVEVFSREALERAGAEAHEPYQREHVTPYLYEQPGRFRTVTIDSGGDFGQLRWTVDTAEDLEFVRQIYQRLSGLGTFGMVDILELLKREPELIEINTDVQQKTSREAG